MWVVVRNEDIIHHTSNIIHLTHIFHLTSSFLHQTSFRSSTQPELNEQRVQSQTCLSYAEVRTKGHEPKVASTANSKQM